MSLGFTIFSPPDAYGNLYHVISVTPMLLFYYSIFLESLLFCFSRYINICPMSVMCFHFISAFVQLLFCFVLFFNRIKCKPVWFIKLDFWNAGIFQELSERALKWYYYSSFLKLKLPPFFSQWSDWWIWWHVCLCYLDCSFPSVSQRFFILFFVF